MQKKETHIRLKAARKAAGFKTAYDFAEHINVPKTTYAQHERGDRNIKDSSLDTYAKALNVNEIWLRTGAGPAFEDPDTNKTQMVDDELRSYDIYKQLSNPDTQTLDKELLKVIIAHLFAYSQQNKIQITPENFSDIVTEIYCSIATTTTDAHQRLAMVPAVVKPYLKTIG